jgi:hypothetical protein
MHWRHNAFLNVQSKLAQYRRHCNYERYPCLPRHHGMLQQGDDNLLV